MRNGSPRSVVLRFVLAVLFGVMSVVPVPLRALAHPAGHHAAAAPAAAQHSAERPHDHGAGGHHHGTPHAVTPPGVGSQDAPPDGAVICQSAACCMAVTQSLPSAPASILLLLGQIAMTPARVIVAVMSDPVVPPPRLLPA